MGRKLQAQTQQTKKLVIRPADSSGPGAVCGKPVGVVANERGFTLIEVMIALVIFTIIGMATFSLMQRALAMRKATQKVGRELADTVRFVGRLQADIEYAATRADLLFEGDPDSLWILHPAPRDDGEQERAEIRYFLGATAEGQDHELFRSATDAQGNRTTERLLATVAEWQCRYLQATPLAPKWRESWRRGMGMPLAVRLRMRLQSWPETREFIYPVRTGKQIESNRQGKPQNASARKR